MVEEHTRQALMVRSRELCEAGLPGCTMVGTDIHHVKFRSRGGSDNLVNLKFLCRFCHNAGHDYKPGTEGLRTRSWQDEGQTEKDDHMMGQD